MSRKQRKQVGKQVTRKRYKKIRYDLVILGSILIVAGVLVYNIIITAQPPSGPETKKENPLEILNLFISAERVKNESLILVYKVRGDVPAGSFVLGTMDYIYVYIGKEITLSNDTKSTVFTSFIYASQNPLYIVAEVLGLAFKSNNFSDVFFNSMMRTTWINSSLEQHSVKVEKSSLLGDVEVVPQVYRYYKVIDGKIRYIEVAALRATNIGYVPIKVEASIDNSKFDMELVDLRRVS